MQGKNDIDIVDNGAVCNFDYDELAAWRRIKKFLESCQLPTTGNNIPLPAVATPQGEITPLCKTCDHFSEGCEIIVTNNGYCNDHAPA